MGKGRKSLKKNEQASSSKKRVRNSKSKESNSSNDGLNNDTKKENENYTGLTITVYKLGNDKYSLDKNFSANIITNNINNFTNYLNPNLISNKNNIDIQIPIKKFNYNKDGHPINYSLNFKNKNFESKLRAKTEKSYRNSKNMKNLGKEGKDAISYKIYCDIEAGPSILPKKKYCDFTGLISNYNELHTGIRYYNSQIYKMSQNIPQPIKDQYLNIRKALIRLK